MRPPPLLLSAEGIHFKGAPPNPLHDSPVPYSLCKARVRTSANSGVCLPRARRPLTLHGSSKGRTPLTMPSIDGAASSIQARMRGRTERKANAAKAKAEEKAAAVAAAKLPSEATAATRMQASIRGRASRKAAEAKAEKAASGSSSTPEQPKKKSHQHTHAAQPTKKKDEDTSPSDPSKKRSTCAPHVAEA